MIKRLKLFALVASLMLFCLTFPGCKDKVEIFHIGILQWTEKVQPFRRTYRGFLNGLKDRGYQDGMNLKIHYRNVEQDKVLALKSARKFVRDEVDLIVALGTGSSLAALEATKKERIPIVFSIVGAPKANGIIKDYNDSGGNITGVSMKIPTKKQLETLRYALPQVKRLGILYCTEMPQAVATGKEAAAVASSLGWTHLVISFPKEYLSQLQQVVQSLVRKVDVIYIPTDPVLGLHKYMKTVIDISDSHNVPVAAVAEKFVEDGALMAVH